MAEARCGHGAVPTPLDLLRRGLMPRLHAGIRYLLNRRLSSHNVGSTASILGSNRVCRSTSSSTRPTIHQSWARSDSQASVTNTRMHLLATGCFPRREVLASRRQLCRPLRHGPMKRSISTYWSLDAPLRTPPRIGLLRLRATGTRRLMHPIFTSGEAGNSGSRSPSRSSLIQSHARADTAASFGA